MRASFSQTALMWNSSARFGLCALLSSPRNDSHNLFVGPQHLCRLARDVCVSVFVFLMASSSVGQSAGTVLQGALDAAASASAAGAVVDIAQLEARRRSLSAERKENAKDIAREKRRRKRILQATKALSEDDLAQELIKRRLKREAA